jgi:glycosyltransferase involved in cell wall biosynthesis
MHGLPLVTATGVNRRILWLSEWLACALAHQVIAVGPSIRDKAIAEGLCRPDKIRVLAAGTISGIDSDNRFDPGNVDDAVRAQLRNQLGLSPTDIVIGYVGRIVQDKGISELLASFTRLSERSAHVHLLIVGPFESRDAILASDRYEIESNPKIHHVGMTLDVHLYYSIMDLFVLPSYREGFPISPMEASSMKLPVVATNIPGCIDAVQDGSTGMLDPPRNVEALSNAIDRYVCDPELRKRDGEAGRARVRSDFRQEVVWDALYQEYARLLRAKNIPLGKESGIAATRIVRNGRLRSRGPWSD